MFFLLTIYEGSEREKMLDFHLPSGMCEQFIFNESRIISAVKLMAGSAMILLSKFFNFKSQNFPRKGVFKMYI